MISIILQKIISQKQNNLYITSKKIPLLILINCRGIFSRKAKMRITSINTQNNYNVNNSPKLQNNPTFCAISGNKLQGLIEKSLYQDFLFSDLKTSKFELAEIKNNLNKFFEQLRHAGDSSTKLDIVEGEPSNQGLVRLVISNYRLNPQINEAVIGKNLFKKSFYKEVLGSKDDIISGLPKAEDVLIRKTIESRLENNGKLGDFWSTVGFDKGTRMSDKCAEETEKAEKIISGIVFKNDYEL